jgi:hypothetical protein
MMLPLARVAYITPEGRRVVEEVQARRIIDAERYPQPTKHHLLAYLEALEGGAQRILHTVGSRPSAIWQARLDLEHVEELRNSINT